MKAWLFQDARQKQKLGDKCPWSCGWFDPQGRKRSKKIGSQSVAQKFRRKNEGEQAAGLCRAGPEQVAWDRFRQEYEKTIMPKWLSAWSRIEARHALDTFEQVVKPKYVNRIDERTLDQYVARRLLMRGKRKGDYFAVAAHKDSRLAGVSPIARAALLSTGMFISSVPALTPV